jgi:hypothetical protein
MVCVECSIEETFNQYLLAVVTMMITGGPYPTPFPGQTISSKAT